MSNPVIICLIAVLLLFVGLFMAWYGSGKHDQDSFLKHIFPRSAWASNNKFAVVIGIVFIIICLVMLFS